MGLEKEKMLFLDCQTTGMHPSIGQILELAWCFAAAADETEPVIQSALFALEGASQIPKRVQEITGIRNQDMANALSADFIRERFLREVGEAQSKLIQVSGLKNEKITALIHYAQFEKPFVEKFLFGEVGKEILPFYTLCSHAISKKLIPQVPSRNIRALSGYFGADLGEVKRAAQHVRATYEIWKGLIKPLQEQNLNSLDEVKTWLTIKPAKKVATKSVKYEYLIEREKRLRLPDAPGIYRMIAKSGKILYVGKATSLKDRVNSYFRGKRGRDARKLEMMAQVWDLQVTECASALEAALLETDEIKKHDPPYNVSLKNTGRQFLFYSRDFNSSSTEQDSTHSLGPFRRFNAIDELQLLSRWLVHNDPSGLFYNLLEIEDLEVGYKKFCEIHSLDSRYFSLRSHLALGYSLWRKQRDKIETPTEPEEEKEITPDQNEELLTPEELADKFLRLYIRAAQAHQRAKTINRLLNARIKWIEGHRSCELEVRNGKIISSPLAQSVQSQPDKLAPEQKWNNLTIADYDRMSVLYSETLSRSAEIEFTYPRLDPNLLP